MKLPRGHTTLKQRRYNVKHTTLKQRRFNVNTLNQRCIDVFSTLCARWVPGKSHNHETQLSQRQRKRMKNNDTVTRTYIQRRNATEEPALEPSAEVLGNFSVQI